MTKLFTLLLVLSDEYTGNRQYFGKLVSIIVKHKNKSKILLKKIKKLEKELLYEHGF